MLVHLLDGSAQGAEGPIGDFEAIQTELAAFSPALANKPQIVVRAPLGRRGLFCNEPEGAAAAAVAAAA